MPQKAVVVGSMLRSGATRCATSVAHAEIWLCYGCSSCWDVVLQWKYLPAIAPTQHRKYVIGRFSFGVFIWHSCVGCRKTCIGCEMKLNPWHCIWEGIAVPPNPQCLYRTSICLCLYFCLCFICFCVSSLVWPSGGSFVFGGSTFVQALFQSLAKVFLLRVWIWDQNCTAC